MLILLSAYKNNLRRDENLYGVLSLLVRMLSDILSCLKEKIYWAQSAFLYFARKLKIHKIYRLSGFRTLQVFSVIRLEKLFSVILEHFSENSTNYILKSSS